MQNKGFTLKVWLPEAMTHDTTRDQVPGTTTRCRDVSAEIIFLLCQSSEDRHSHCHYLLLSSSGPAAHAPTYLIIDIGRTWAEIRNTEFRKK